MNSFVGVVSRAKACFLETRSAEDEVLCRGSGPRIWEMQSGSPKISFYSRRRRRQVKNLAKRKHISLNKDVTWRGGLQNSRHSAQILAYYIPTKQTHK